MGVSTKRCVLAVAAAVAPALSLAAEGPRAKPGLWEVSNTFESPAPRGQPVSVTMTMQHCVGEKNPDLWDPSRAAWGLHPSGSAPEGSCPQPTHSRDGEAHVWTTECKTRQGIVKTRSRTVVQDNRFDTDLVLEYDPPYNGIRKSNAKIVGKFIGACPAGMKPGAVRVTSMPMPGQMPPMTR
jgi:hypothetical protein